MPRSAKKSTLNDPFKLTVLIFGIIAFMYFTGEVLKPLALAVLLSFALAPAVRSLERWGVPRVVSVVLTVVVALGLLGGVGYIVGRQLTSLAVHLDDYQDEIDKKIGSVMEVGRSSTGDKLQLLADRVTARLEKRPHVEEDGSSTAEAAIPKVSVVQEPSPQERLRTVVGPYLGFLGMGSFVLILVMFMLMGRDDLGDRIIGLFGHRRISLTTRTLDEIARRITRYLATFALVNSGYGLVVGIGLGAIGVPYAVLWGCLAAGLRFIPYVGPGVAFLLPLVFSFAYFPGWRQPLEVVVLFVIIEVVLNSFLEPIIYGKTTGISALGLLVAAMFWTWLWGTLGLLLSTPLTVCLAVLGKYVPGLGFFGMILGEEADLDPEWRFYQRLVSLDREGAFEVVETALKTQSRAAVFDSVLIPALRRSERDASEGDLEEPEQAFLWQVISEIIDHLEAKPDPDVKSSSPVVADGSGSETEAHPNPEVALLGIAVIDTSDELALKMLAQLLKTSNCTLEIVADDKTPLEVLERVAEVGPKLVVVSHVPPGGLADTRYMVRRLRAQFPDLPIVVGRWSEGAGIAAVTERLVALGATNVVSSLVDARDWIVSKVTPAPALSPLTAQPQAAAIA